MVPRVNTSAAKLLRSSFRVVWAGVVFVVVCLAWVVLFLLVFTWLAWLMKREYWKDVH